MPEGGPQGSAEVAIRVPADPLDRRRALIVEDDAFTRTLLAELLQAHGFETMEHATSGAALREFETFDPDVLVVDIQLAEPPNGAQLAYALHARAPYLGIVVVSQYPSPTTAVGASPLPPGAAFVHKSRIESATVLLEAIESVLDDRLAPARLAAERDGSAIGSCTATQVEILRLIALGYSNERIARERGTSVRAVEQIVHRIYVRLGLDGDADGNVRVLAARTYAAAFGLPAREP